MPFPSNPDMTAAEFKRDIVDYYFPHFSAGDARKQLLAQDYAEIGAFLTKKRAVLSALIGLEKELRKHLIQSTPPDFRDKVLTHQTGASPLFKANKALSSVLSRIEIMEGFNNPVIFDRDENLGRFNSQTTFATGTDSFNMTTAGRSSFQGSPEGPRIHKPVGVPTIAGENLPGVDFNRTLLAHGYQFKDVGAGVGHGEFTHRLQWNAICHAKAQGDLTLHHDPLTLFKSMGSYPSSQATANVPAPLPQKGKFPAVNMHLYLWEALFDNFPSQSIARNNSTLAWCNNTFNGPEILNTALTVNATPPVYDESKPDNLFCLRVFLSLRQRKRLDQVQRGVDYIDKLYSNKPKAVTVAGTPGKVDKDHPLAVAIFWHTH